MDLLRFFNPRVLELCLKIDEGCVKDAFSCEKEVSVGPWRADLKCGDVYVEVEPVERLACGLGQVMLWSIYRQVPVALVLFGKQLDLPPEELSKVVPILYIDIVSKTMEYFVK